MRGILVIAGRELRSLFMSPMFFIVAGLCTTLWSLVYVMSVEEFAKRSAFQAFQQRGEQGGMSVHFELFARHISLVNLIMIFAVSALTMRLFAEEKRQRTYDLLMTSPVNATQIVLGKFLGGLGAAWALVAVSFLYPVIQLGLSPIEWGPLASSYVGLLLLVGSYVAIGMFASSMTEHPVIAVIVSLIFNVGIWFMGAGTDLSDNELVSKVFAHLSVGTHFFNFIRGSVGVASTVFFLSVMFFSTFLTQRVIESSRWR